jgi:hypothetical protein
MKLRQRYSYSISTAEVMCFPTHRSCCVSLKLSRHQSSVAMASLALYVPYRAIGSVTDGVPFVLNILGDEQFLIASIGKAFQVRFLPPSSHFHFNLPHMLSSDL